MNEEKTTVIVSEDYTRAVTLTRSIIANAQAAQQSLYEVCKGLYEMREQKLYKELGYSNFENYCENEVGITRRQGGKYAMIGSALTEENAKSTSHFKAIGTEKLYLLAKLDEPTREAVTETVDVESVTVKELKAQIRSLTDENAENEYAAKLLSEELSTAKDNIAKKEKQFAEAMESKKRELDSFKDSAERSKKSFTARIGDLEEQIKELENRPVEVAVSEEELKEIERLRAELEDSRLRQVQAEKAAQVKADLAASAVREEYEKQLAEAREAAKPDAVPDTKGIFKAYYTNAVDAMRRVTQFVSEHTADENMPLYLKKLDDIIAFAETELTKLKVDS